MRESLRIFKELSDTIGPRRVVWRYDPVIITDSYSAEYHARRFNEIAEELKGYTVKSIFSFADYYKKTVKNM